MVNCLTDRGWTVHETGNGYGSDDIPFGQEEPFQVDVDACLHKFGYDLPINYTEDVIRRLYDNELAARECLANLGHEDPEQPPSFQEYLETWNTEDAWYAYRFLMQDGRPADWAALNRECPQATL